MHFEEHYARLDALAQLLTVAPISTSRKELKQLIGEALQREGMSSQSVNAVCVRYNDMRKLEVEVVEMLYNCLSLRSIRPIGSIYRLSGELLLKNTSAKEEMLAINRLLAEEEGCCRVPIWVGEGDELLAIDGAGVIVVFEDEIRFSERVESVEMELAYRAAKMLNRTVNKGAIMLSELADAKELFAIDYRGITAIEGWNGHRYMDITATKLAHRIAEAER